MGYGEEFVKSVVGSVLSGRCSARAMARAHRISRSSVDRWVRRTLAGMPTRLGRAAKHVWNRTAKPVLAALRAPLKAGKSAVVAWIATGKAISLRTAQRWKAQWFPSVKERKKWKRYVRRKAHSLLHTDWAEQRIAGGKRTCFTFYIDDATRRIYALRAYERATEENTADALRRAVEQSGGFAAVLSDCGAVYSKAFAALCADVRVRSIHTRPYHPQCNGKAEAVVKKVKRFLAKHHVRDLAHMNELLALCERELNRSPHSGLNYATPLQAYAAKQGAGLIWGVT